MYIENIMRKNSTKTAKKKVKKRRAENSTGTARKPPGRPFKPGQSGNTGGRPKALAEVHDAARDHTMAAIDVLVKCMADKNPYVRIAAANAILDRGWGKATQAIESNEAALTHEQWLEVLK